MGGACGGPFFASTSAAGFPTTIGAFASTLQCWHCALDYRDLVEAELSRAVL